jgi:putative ABC transport system permease protein
VTPGGPVPLGPWELTLAALLLVAYGAVSVGLRLGLERRLAVATVRATVQLVVLGVVLVPVFAWSSPWPVVLWCVVMVVLAGREATARTARTHRGMLARSVLAMGLGGGGAAVFATVVVLSAEPWWAPRYLVPLVGMVLGNALTGVSLGLDKVLEGLDAGGEQVEALLALGATRWEATQPLVAEAVRTGMVPILNSMSAVGLVTIPGMMTGQILGGTPPLQAALYQLLILFVIAGAVAVGTTVAVIGAVSAVVDGEHRLRRERVARR